ncbi:MAG: cysteine desulfurase NifS [Lentisphaeria bacterium]|nr:cysteine desulfurase NifS [Lentisphaeria bacterium]
MNKQVKTVYLDNNATTRVAPEVVEKMLPFFTERYGNPSSIHSFGGSVMPEIENARRQVAELIGADFRNKDNIATEIIFTSCGTESDNAAILSALATQNGRKKIVTGRIEHPAVLSLCKDLERRGYEIVTIGVDGKGRVSLDDFRNAIDENTAIVSMMWANNEIGNIYPVEKIAEIAHEKGALFHTDAVQAVGKIPIDMSKNTIDFLSLSGHKLHAPKGVGVLYVRRGVRFHPFLIGGHQEMGRRGGTENAASVIGLGEAARLAKETMDQEVIELAELRDRLEKGLLERVPKIRINGDIESRLPNTSSVSFEFIEGESILMLLDAFGICASSGSACTTGSLEPSHVLRAMGLPYTAAHGTIRFSFSRYNTIEDVDFVLEKLPPIIERLRKISPYWSEK